MSSARLDAAATAALGHLPRALWLPGAEAAGALMGRCPPAPVRQWMLNAEVMTGRRPAPARVRRAVVSWMRTSVTSMQLPRWSAAGIRDAVIWDGDGLARLHRAFTTRGAVVALPHMGSWDLAGAAVAGRGMPVTTVAERLPEPRFELFVAARERLGMRVHAHDEPGVMRYLMDDVTSGRLVCLVADRDFSRRGVPVAWDTGRGPVPGSMPPGPAHLAVMTGAALIGAACHYTDAGHMRIDLSAVLEPPSRGTTRERAGELTGRLAGWMSTRVRAHVEDWHMFQPFFEGVRP